MVNPAAEALAVVLLIGVLGFAIVRPRGLPEALAAVPAAVPWPTRSGAWDCERPLLVWALGVPFLEITSLEITSRNG